MTSPSRDPDRIVHREPPRRHRRLRSARQGPCAPKQYRLQQPEYAWRGDKLEAHGELSSEQVSVVGDAAGFLLKAILQFKLRVRGKTIAGGQIEADEVRTPMFRTVLTGVNRVKDLLIPAQCSEQL